MLFFALSLKAQDLVCDTSLLGIKKVTLILPQKYKKKVFNYDEGIFIDYYFQHGEVITLFSGANQRIPILNYLDGYVPNVRKQDKNMQSIRGIRNNKGWREDSISSIRILYNNVSLNRIATFDLILDSMIINDDSQ